MALDKIVIEFSSDPKSLQSTIDQLEKLKKVDKETGDQVRKHTKEHTAALGDLGTETGRLERKMQNLGEHIVAAFAVERVFEFAKETVKAFEEAEEAGKRLKFAVENINKGGSQGLSELVEQSKTLSSELNNLFTEKQIQMAQTQMAQAKISSGEILKYMPLILDVSAKSGKGLEEVTQKFVSAAEIGGKGLKEFGAKFADTGDKIKNLSKAAEEMKGFIGGAADALDDYSSAAKISENRSEMLKETIGGALTPAWEGFKTVSLEALANLMSINFEFDKMNKAAAESDVAAYAASEGLKNATHDQLVAMEKMQQKELDFQRFRQQAAKEAGESITDQMYEDLKSANNMLVAIQRQLKQPGTPLSKKEEYQKDIVDKKEHGRELDKLSSEEIQKRLDLLNEGILEESGLKDSATDKEIQKEIGRLNKVLAERKKADEKNIEARKKAAEDLKKITQEIADEEGKASIELIKDKYQKDNVIEDDAFRKKKIMLEEQRRKLSDDIKNGDQKTQESARIQLEETYKEENLLTEAHYFKLTNLAKEATDRENKIREEEFIKRVNFEMTENAELEKDEQVSLSLQLSKKEITQREYDEKSIELKKDLINIQSELDKESNEVAQNALLDINTKKYKAVEDEREKELTELKTRIADEQAIIDTVKEKGRKASPEEKQRKIDAEEKQKLDKQDLEMLEKKKQSETDNYITMNILRTRFEDTDREAKKNEDEDQAKKENGEKIEIRRFEDDKNRKNARLDWTDAIRKKLMEQYPKEEQDTIDINGIKKPGIHHEDVEAEATKLEQLDNKEIIRRTKKNSALLATDKETVDKQAEYTKKMIESIHDFTKTIVSSIETAINSNIAALDVMSSRQESMIETQRVLASKGLANDLAFEQKKADQLEAQKLKDIKKLQRTKELEVFLNSLAKFAEENPNTALPKALGMLAATKVAEVAFQEEGGVIGQGPKFTGQKHKSGKDRLVMAEDGEGMLSVKDMNALGGPAGFNIFRNMLHSPLREIPVGGQPKQKDFGSEIVNRLESLEKTIKDKKELQIDWDNLDTRIETSIERGVKERLRIYNKKTRL